MTSSTSPCLALFLSPPIVRLPDELPPQPDISGALLFPLQKVTTDLPKVNISANVINTQNTPRISTDNCKGREL